MVTLGPHPAVNKAKDFKARLFMRMELSLHTARCQKYAEGPKAGEAQAMALVFLSGRPGLGHEGSALPFWLSAAD